MTPYPMTFWGLVQLGAEGTGPAGIDVWVGSRCTEQGQKDQRKGACITLGITKPNRLHLSWGK